MIYALKGLYTAFINSYAILRSDIKADFLEIEPSAKDIAYLRNLPSSKRFWKWNLSEVGSPRQRANGELLFFSSNNVSLVQVNNYYDLEDAINHFDEHGIKNFVDMFSVAKTKGKWILDNIEECKWLKLVEKCDQYCSFDVVEECLSGYLPPVAIIRR